MLIFLGFLYGISRWKDIRRVFEYHGAEHKVVFNFESRQPVTVENARRFSTFHPRCGTSFLLVVMVISIGVYALIPFDGFFLRFLFRILLLPLIAGISYELIRFAAKNRGSFLAATHRARSVAPANHDATPGRRPTGRGHPRPGWRHGPGEGAGRRTRGSLTVSRCNTDRSWTISKRGSRN